MRSVDEGRTDEGHTPGVLRARAQEALAQLRPELADAAVGRLGEREGAAFLARVDRYLVEAFEPLARLYGGSHDIERLVGRLIRQLLDSAAERSQELRILDHRREVEPDWFLRETMVGYVCYTDQFAQDLQGLRKRLDYLGELGVTYLHLMPLLKPRSGANDGGYAVQDYHAVDPRLGSMADLEMLAAEMRGRGISLCVDLVVNHTAAEHEWARKAAAGDDHYRDFYLTFTDRSLPDAYSQTLPEVFPETAPGNFTWVADLDAWVWTTFHDYQWDLDYSNPNVFTEMLGVMLALANRGVEALRLDAVPFTGKRMGTDCQNQPEAHWLLQAFRALMRIAAPATVFKAEAIVGPGQLVQYLGAHDRERPECELAYHNQLMVMLWSAAASRDAVLATHALQRMRKPPPDTGWVAYVRCHDDIGWAVDDADAAAAGIDASAHRAFLNEFYAGEFPGSFADGARFQADPATGDARISGTTAALAGIDRAREAADDTLLDAAIRRVLLLHAVAFGWGGLPLVYMGDEIGLGNDFSWRDDPMKAGDNRWMHRPPMDWDAADRRFDPTSVEGRLFAGFQQLATARRRAVALHAMGHTEPLWTGNAHVLAWRRNHPRLGPLLGLANFDDCAQSVDAAILGAAALPAPLDALDHGRPVPLDDGRIHLEGLSARWLIEA